MSASLSLLIPVTFLFSSLPDPFSSSGRGLPLGFLTLSQLTSHDTGVRPYHFSGLLLREVGPMIHDFKRSWYPPRSFFWTPPYLEVSHLIHDSQRSRYPPRSFFWTHSGLEVDPLIYDFQRSWYLARSFFKLLIRLRSVLISFTILRTFCLWGYHDLDSWIYLSSFLPLLRFGRLLDFIPFVSDDSTCLRVNTDTGH